MKFLKIAHEKKYAILAITVRLLCLLMLQERLRKIVQSLLTLQSLFHFFFFVSQQVLGWGDLQKMTKEGKNSSQFLKSIINFFFN